MALENLTGPSVFISNLVQTNPTVTDPVSEGDDHVRGIKNVLLNTFPNITGAVTLTQDQINALAAASAQVPIAGMLDYTGDVLPANFLWVPTAPTNISRTTYSQLFLAVNTLWGAGDGVNTFGMPWVPDSMPTLNSATVASQKAGTIPSHLHRNPSTTTSLQLGATGIISLGGSGTTNTDATGTGANNMPAGMTIRKIIRYQ